MRGERSAVARDEVPGHSLGGRLHGRRTGEDPRAPDRPQVGAVITELYETAALVRSRGDAVARAAGQSQARWQVLFTLAGGPLPVPLLARRLGLTRQSVQRIVDLLARDGLVVPLANPAHQRSPLFALTEAGGHTLRQVNAAAADWHAAVRTALSADEQEDLRRLLANLRAVATRFPAGPAPRAGRTRDGTVAR